jgi:catechol 2,3-dioxygenase-like lactoylglutathione lyase family enzyme
MWDSISPTSAFDLKSGSPSHGEVMEPRISMITLGVSDLEESVKFYKRGLGFPKMDSPPGVAFFTLNGTWLGLYPKDLLAEDAAVPPAGNGFKGFTLAHNVTSVAEVESVIRRAVEAGAKLVKTPQQTSWGGFSGYFEDLDGYLWEVAHNPHFWVGPESQNPQV